MKISVIIPAYNEESCLSHCIESIRAQNHPAAAIPTSIKTENLLLEAGIKIIQHKEVNQLIPVYIDSADVIDYSGQAIKGGGGAHRIEKQVASLSRTWVCIIDEKWIIDEPSRLKQQFLQLIAEIAVN